MTDTPRFWDRRADETPKSYAAFLAYVALGARRSVREAARQHCVKTASSGPKNTIVKHWLRWSARHKVGESQPGPRRMDRAHLGRPDRVERDGVQTGAHPSGALDFLTANDGPNFLRAARGAQLALPADSARGGCLGAD